MNKSKILGLVSRVLIVSWLCFGALPASAFEVEVAEAPTNNLTLTVKAIQSAQQTLLLNIYELTSPQIADALINRVNAGVRVTVLEEGQPVGGLSAAARGIQSQVVQAMQRVGGASRFFEMTSKAGSSRRYRFDHAKYAVVDGSALLIGSENYSPTGNPQPGSLGNRGWEVFIHDTNIAQQFQTIFVQDSDTTRGDVLDVTTGNLSAMGLTVDRAPSNPQVPVVAIPSLSAVGVESVLSPDTSLSGIVRALNQATSSIDIQQMTFDSAWKGADQSPLVDAVLAAAKRGVRVRVLLNDENVFSHGSATAKPKNSLTIDLFNQAAAQGKLNLSARVANLKAMGVDYIHNKGLLIDSDKTLVSSINWDENSVEKNREAAVLITSTDVHAHYEALFERDWQLSGGNLGLVSSLDFATTEVSQCPESLSVEAKIGQLLIHDHEDSDFSALSNTTISGKYGRSRNARGCVLLGEESALGVGGRSYIQVREAADGTRAVILEGYTPKTQKMFSIRTKILGGGGISGKFSAIVYDGSGPTREQLGLAEMSISDKK